jgi:NADPH:quinone reductase-like Zn-dependent oxidoreductase
MSKAVQFDHFGDVKVLHLVDVPMPQVSPGRVVVEVRAAGINPGEISIRTGAMEGIFPTHFPSGEGSDFSGVVVAVGPNVTDFKVADAVLGWTNERASHATHLSVPTSHLVRKPSKLSWEVAGSLYVAGLAAWASVEAIEPANGETVVVSGAAGGVGSFAVQLLLLQGARVLAIASARNHSWLKELGAVPVAYGEGLKDRLKALAPEGIDAWIDVFGKGYVELATSLGVDPARINTTIDFQGAKKVGAKTLGTQSVASAEVLGALADLVASGKIQVPIAATYPLDRVQDAFRQLEKRQTRGKIVLVN